jgi:ABC-type uncharacterized transport system involved in gliding motility auxiliary subunit
MRFKFGANLVAFSIVVTVLWAMINYLNVRHHRRFDLTENRQYSLSPKTVAVLQDLKEPFHITTLYRPGTFIFRQVKDILDEYAAASPWVRVEHIDAERDRGKVELLARRLNMDTFELNTVIFESGGKSKHVPESEVIEYDYGGFYQRREPSPPKFKGEEAFTSAILECIQDRQSVVYFVSGHGERGIDDTYKKSGMADAVKRLVRQNFRVENLLLLGKNEVPADCDVLGIVGPQKKFSDREVDVLREYLSSGGKCLVMIDPLVDCGLEGLLEERGVKLGNDIVLDPVRRLFFTGPTTVFTDEYGYHEITRQMKGVATIFPLARSVEFSGGGMFQGTEFVRTSQESWGETNVRAKEAKYDEGEDKKGPVSIAVAVAERKSPDSDVEGESGGMRLVVFGDSDIISNAQIGNVGNSDIFLNSISWLAEKERLISIGPRTADVRKVSISAGQMRVIFWSTVVGLPLLAVFIGVFVWWRRRK